LGKVGSPHRAPRLGPRALPPGLRPSLRHRSDASLRGRNLPVGGPMHVLLIEDDRMSARGLELALTAAGFHFENATTGEAGAELAEAYAYDCILLDLGLPDMNGLDLLRRLRRGKTRTPVVVLSGAVDVER